VKEIPQDSNGGFENLAWLFSCDSRNRGIIAQGFDEAAMLWKAAAATGGSILEIGRKRAGSTVVLAAAGRARKIYSIDLRLRPHPLCREYLTREENRDRIELRIANSRDALPGVRYGLLFIDGDHTFEGVLADVIAHWNALEDADGKPGLAVFHDAVPNDNYRWRDEHRRFKRLLTRAKNKFRVRQKPEISPDYSIGVFRVCEALIHFGLARHWNAAGSMRALAKLGDLPEDFAARVRAFKPMPARGVGAN